MTAGFSDKLVPLVLGLVLLALLMMPFWLIVRRPLRRRLDARGFEVKLNTGEEPVTTKERETDHG